MSGLIERLESAEVGSRELDKEIYSVFSPPIIQTDLGPPPGFGGCGDEGFWGPEYTRSLGAALALVERVLPGLGAWDIGYAYNASPAYQARLVVVREGDPEIFARAATSALALCIAILRAKASTPDEVG